MEHTSKRKKGTAAVAGVVALALLVGGTFAWQSISQTALNEKEMTVNPGGRLHVDFDGTNKDVYAENFADEDIYTRVRLDEYFEIIINQGTDAEQTEVVTAGAERDDEDTYVTHKFGTEGGNTTDTYWEWKTGGKTTYMPTFNKNKDSLVPDVNGTMRYTDADGNADPYGDYVDYSLEANKSKTATEIYDGDSNTTDEVGDDFDNLGNYAANVETVENVEHTVRSTAEGKGLISMNDWLNRYYANDYSISGLEDYWVYDTDGWVYWSAPIKKGTATSLLLDEVNLATKLDDSYYYAINAIGQFITADDLGKSTNTGFYANRQAPSDDALTLLDAIGVDTSGEDYVSPLEITIEPDVDYYLTGSDNTTIDLALSATYDGEKVEASELSDVTWKAEAAFGTLDPATKLTSTTGAATQLFVMASETSDIKVSVTASYKGETVDGAYWISNGPPVRGRTVYGSDGKVLWAVDSYVEGVNQYELCFFADYYSSILDYDKSTAYTGELQKYLARDLEWVLLDENWEETTVAGVTVETDVSDPAKVTVTIPQGFDQEINLGCKDEYGAFLSQGLVKQPTGMTLSLTDSANAKVTDNGTDITVTATNGADLNLQSSCTNYPEESLDYSFEGLKTTTSGYTISKVDDYGSYLYYLHADDVEEDDWEFNSLVTFSEYDGVITVHSYSEVSKDIVITGKVTAALYGTEVTRNLTITLTNPKAEVHWSGGNVSTSGKNVTMTFSSKDTASVIALNQKGSMCPLAFTDMEIIKGNEDDEYHLGTGQIYDNWGQNILKWDDSSGSITMGDQPYKDLQVTCKMVIAIDGKTETYYLTINISGNA